MKKIQYALDNIEEVITSTVEQHTGYSGRVVLGKPPSHIEADYGVQLSSVAKASGQNLEELANTLAEEIKKTKKDGPFESVKTQGPYLNLRLNIESFGNKVVEQIAKMESDYGKKNVGKGKVVVVDMSSPNIAKRMSIGHLRSTIIGDALANIYRAQGFEVIRDNHLGDWGTQFGKLIVAIKKWGDEQELLKSDDPIGILQDLYVKFHDEAEKQTEKLRERVKTKAKRDIEAVIETDLEKEGRKWFLKLEQGDKEARRLWEICVDLSLKEFDAIYKVLGVNFEKTLGESFYKEMLPGVISEVKKSGKAEISEGALVVDLKGKKLGVAIIQKSDGATVYLTRDLATAFYRESKMKAHKAIYVVGEEQKLYFRQLFEVLKRLGHKIGDNSIHVYFGMVTLPEGRMSTRRGRVVLLKDVLSRGFVRAEKVIEKKNPDLFKDEKLRDDVVRQIAVGALKWNDLSSDPRRSIVFDWDEALNLEGYSAPYVQYAAVRCNSILRETKGKTKKIKLRESGSKAPFSLPVERELVKKLAAYPRILIDARKTNDPSKIATYVYDLAKTFNSFYNSAPVLAEKKVSLKKSRLKLVSATSQVISNSLGILGIEVPALM